MRPGKLWATVTVTGKELTTTPEVQCNDCGKQFCGGATRIGEGELISGMYSGGVARLSEYV